MLTIVFIFIAFWFLVVASPSPIDRETEGFCISLARRQDLISDVANIEALIQALQSFRR